MEITEKPMNISCGKCGPHLSMSTHIECSEREIGKKFKEAIAESSKRWRKYYTLGAQ